MLDPARRRYDGPIDDPIRGEPDAEGVRPVLGYKPGFRVNTPLALMTPEEAAFRVFPERMLRLWAGVETAALLFADETEARSVIPAQFWAD